MRRAARIFLALVGSVAVALSWSAALEVAHASDSVAQLSAASDVGDAALHASRGPTITRADRVGTSASSYQHFELSSAGLPPWNVLQVRHLAYKQLGQFSHAAAARGGVVSVYSTAPPTPA